MIITIRILVAAIFAPILFAACCFGALYCFASTLVDFIAGNTPAADKPSR
jgi:hypothetical protein